jgi:hypothetical protein
MKFPGKQMRLNVFPKGSGSWDFRPKVWIKDAPLPKGEDFVKL